MNMISLPKLIDVSPNTAFNYILTESVENCSEPCLAVELINDLKHLVCDCTDYTQYFVITGYGIGLINEFELCEDDFLNIVYRIKFHDCKISLYRVYLDESNDKKYKIYDVTVSCGVSATVSMIAPDDCDDPYSLLSDKYECRVTPYLVEALDSVPWNGIKIKEKYSGMTNSEIREYKDDFEFINIDSYEDDFE